ncbi:hypothetical protein [Pinisolibacter sp.]|uniref:hypothetical protein n=1 Tax=Pinisolibacter sp. TaxID=2172024 RepID=UPI002FDCFF2F
MYDRLNDLPVLDTYPSRVPAAVWNIWRRYRSRMHRGACFGLEGLAPMSLLLEEDAWVLMDSGRHDMPVLAWSDFRDQGRGLHEPVRCIVRHYHQGASAVRDKALALMAEELETRLRER